MNLSLLSHFYRKWRLVEKDISKIILCTKDRCFSSLPAIEPKIEESEPNKYEYVNPLWKPDFFEVNNMFTIQDLFNARVHYGHKFGSLNEKMTPYIFGHRLGHIIFDLEQTATNMRVALNFIAHMAYRDAIFLFVSNYHQHCMTIEKAAMECEEFAHTRTFNRGLFTNSHSTFKVTVRFPDVVILLSTLSDVLHEHIAVTQAAKLNIPTVGIVDSNSDPTIITYPVPGNDDSPAAIELYCKLFKTAILKGKNYKKKEESDIKKWNKMNETKELNKT